MRDFLQIVSDYSSWIIGITAVLHLCVFLWVLYLRTHRVKKLGAALKEVLDKSGFGTSIMADLGDDDLIDSCCQDILNDLKKGSADGRLGKMQRELARFEDLKPYKKTSYVEVWYNAVRTGVEIYPLLGILGTIIALGLAACCKSHSGATSS